MRLLDFLIATLMLAAGCGFILIGLTWHSGFHMVGYMILGSVFLISPFYQLVLSCIPSHKVETVVLSV